VILGCRPGQIAHGGQQHVLDHRGEGGDPHGPGQAVGEPGQLLLRLDQLLLDPLGVPGQDPPGRSERDAPLRTVDEREPDLPFELGKLLGDR
jgi:hypothetical protein